MAASRTVIVAGAGIGGLTAALALAAKQFRVVIVEQAEQLGEIGAGIQLSPNATRILIALGVGEKLKNKIVVPQAVRIKSAWSGQNLAQVALGQEAEFRFGAPYWVVHRGDLHAALLASARANPDIVIKTGLRVTDFAIHGHGITAQAYRGLQADEQRGVVLVGADGLWSVLRKRMGDDSEPHFRARTAWRALLPASDVAEDFRTPFVNLWLGKDAHLVHYPVSGGDLINIVAIVKDEWQGEDWSATGKREDLLAQFPKWRWSQSARTLLATPQHWAKWALCERPVRRGWGRGPLTLLGDAAHPMLPFIGQGAAMAIEDAAILANCLADGKNDLVRALRLYEGLRRPRTARVQRAARATGQLYHLGGPLALARNLGIRMMGGGKLRSRYDWIYDWRPS